MQLDHTHTHIQSTSLKLTENLKLFARDKMDFLLKRSENIERKNKLILMYSRNQNIVNVCYSLVLIYTGKKEKILNISVNTMESDKA